MYEKILVAVDHSEVTPRVLEAARGLAALSQAEVWVVHLREHETVGAKGPLTSRESAQEARTDVTGAVETLTRAGVKAHGVVRHTVFGHAAREIISEAQERGADVIVVGSRGRGDLAGLLLGSTAHKVIHLADRQVLVVRAAAVMSESRRPAHLRSTYVDSNLR
jgi:nucleotide-binding universal stress UspA family protein